MKKQNSTKDNINLFFSSFLVIAYIICAYFFLQYANTVALTNSVLGATIVMAVFVVFGLLMFYATRVGEGKTVFRFSLPTLIFMVLPSLYAVAAHIVTLLPLSEYVSGDSGLNGLIAYMAAIILGYGIPYTFISGFETVREEEPITSVVEGGIEEALLEAQEDTEEPTEEEDEVVFEGESSTATEEEKISDTEDFEVSVEKTVENSEKVTVEVEFEEESQEEEIEE